MRQSGSRFRSAEPSFEERKKKKQEKTTPLVAFVSPPKHTQKTHSSCMVKLSSMNHTDKLHLLDKADISHFVLVPELGSIGSSNHTFGFKGTQPSSQGKSHLAMEL